VKTWPLFRHEVLRFVAREPQLVDVPDGQSAAEVHEIIETTARAVPAGVALTLDVTHGYRHFPFVLYALVLYLQTLRDVRIQGAYYGMVEAASEQKPIVDLRSLLELPEWLHAVRVFRETGSTSPLVRLAQPTAEQIRAKAKATGNNADLHRQATAAEQFLSRLQQIGFAFGSGLPLELGKAATLLLTVGEQAIPSVLRPSLPLGEDISLRLTEAVASFRFSSPPTWTGEWKQKLSLTDQELEREARLIDALLERDQLPVAVGLLEEWIVSWLIHKQGNPTDWLSFRMRRRRVASQLSAISAHVASNDEELAGDVKAWGNFWTQLTALRNTLHHHGMRETALEAPQSSLQSLVSYWKRIRQDEVKPPKLGGGAGRSLITAQGTRPGVLFSALQAVRPDRCLVVCSEQTSGSTSVAAAAAGYSGAIEHLMVADPYAGFDELDALVVQSRRWLLDADKVVANLTGGTTLMGVLVQQLVEAAGKLDRPTHRFVLIDRRPPEEQDASPYVASDVHWIDQENANCDQEH
jgi:CRISPR-associated DxTHG motif protein